MSAVADERTPQAAPPQAGAPATPAPITPEAYLRLIALAALIGIPAAFLAAIFLAIVHWLESWLWDDLPKMLGYTDLPWFLVLGLPVTGALIVILARKLLPGDGGGQPLLGLEAGATPPRNVPGVFIAALGTLPFGVILGPEMPVIAIGSAVGVAVNRFIKLDPRESAVLANAGSFSAISALFGGPLVAGMLLVESGLSRGAMLIPILLPGLVAAAVGYLIFVGFGNFGGIPEAGLTVPSLPTYTGVHPGDLLIAVIVGIAAVIAVYIARYIAVRTDGLVPKIGMPVVLIGGGLAIGAIALVCELLGANPNDVLFSGQSALPDLISAQSVGLVLLLLVAKVLGYGISLGSGFRGGPIFPAIFLGVALASIFVAAFGVSPTLAIAVGTAAGMAAQSRLLFAPLLFSSLLVGQAGVETIPAAVFAAVSAWLLSTALHNRGRWPQAKPAVA